MHRLQIAHIDIHFVRRNGVRQLLHEFPNHTRGESGKYQECSRGENNEGVVIIQYGGRGPWMEFIHEKYGYENLEKDTDIVIGQGNQ